MGVIAVLRQTVPVERIASWYTGLVISWVVLGHLYVILYEQVRDAILLPVVAIVVIVAIAWVVLARNSGLWRSRVDEV